MPGLLSNVFDGGPEGDGQDGASGQSQSYDGTLEAGQDLNLDPSINVGIEMGGSYQNLDGSTTTWSNSQTIGVDADVDATVGAVLDTGTDQTSYEA